MFLEHFRLGLSCFHTSGLWTKNVVSLFEHSWVLRAFRGRTIGMPGRWAPAQGEGWGDGGAGGVLGGVQEGGA
eukprot:6277035-Pyramimonas_sp.AAC.1